MARDFVEIVAGLTGFIERERLDSYNEGVDMILDSIREWMRNRGISASGDNAPDLLDEIAAHLQREAEQ